MPKKNKPNNRIIRTPTGDVLFKGSCLLNPTLAVGSNVVGLTPNTLNAGQLGNLSQTFSQYRFEKLKVIPYPGQSDTYNVAYYNETSDVPASTLITNQFIPHSSLITDGTFVPRPFNVNKGMLVGENSNKFWRTFDAASSSSTWEETQGTINIVAEAAISVFILFKYALRLVNAVTTGMTPSPVIRKSMVTPAMEHLPIIDMYLNGHATPYPMSRNHEADWLRVHVIAAQIRSKVVNPLNYHLPAHVKQTLRIKGADDSK